VVILVPVARRTPTATDAELLVRSLRHSGQFARVGVDLSELEVASSSLVAELVILRRRIREAGGRLFLFALNPFVRASLHRLRLDQVFEIVEPEGDAVWSEPAAMMATH
jgi:anti-anti-sigma regulatory factor